LADQCRPGAIDVAGDIDIQYPLEVLWRNLGQQAERADRCVVDPHIQAPEFLDGTGCQFLHLARVGYVGGDGDGVPAAFPALCSHGFQ
jgi:hypothetical protein